MNFADVTPQESGGGTSTTRAIFDPHLHPNHPRRIRGACIRGGWPVATLPGEGGRQVNLLPALPGVRGEGRGIGLCIMRGLCIDYVWIWMDCVVMMHE